MNQIHEGANTPCHRPVSILALLSRRPTRSGVTTGSCSLMYCRTQLLTGTVNAAEVLLRIQSWLRLRLRRVGSFSKSRFVLQTASSFMTEYSKTCALFMKRAHMGK
jgi:hypothetical protein